MDTCLCITERWLQLKQQTDAIESLIRLLPPEEFSTFGMQSPNKPKEMGLAEAITASGFRVREYRIGLQFQDCTASPWMSVVISYSAFWQIRCRAFKDSELSAIYCWVLFLH